MMKNKSVQGHAAALFTMALWSTTYISTKVLLQDFQPIEILFFRFLIGLITLKILSPHILKTKNWREEVTFIAAGFCGVCLFYLLENIALTYTMASNAGVIASVSPFFTAILMRIFMKEEGKLTVRFFVGFVVAMAGISLISFNGAKLEVNMTGDLLMLFAAFIWACYSLLTKKIADFGYPTIATTAHTFFYGLLFMVVALFIFDFRLGSERFLEPKYVLNLLFLGLGASAACFVTWNFAVRALGAVKTAVYIYLVPVGTVAAAVLILHEPITLMSTVGIVLTLGGLFLSSGKNQEDNPKKGENLA